jgi:ATP-dependent helicase/nuclease subunit B
MPSVKFILSALRIKRYNWRTGDVISHLKTGLCGIDATDADLFEEYVNTWDIHGEQFLLGEWTMNPDGFTDKLSPRAMNILEAANRVREALTAPLLKLFVLLDAAENVADSCRALYKYMLDISLEDKLAELSKKAAERGDIKQARELSRIYGVMLSTLASVAEAIGDEEADCEELTLILKTIFDKTEIGSIPTSIDEVAIGSASTFRASGVRYALIMGLCEGEFPAAVNDNGVFSEGDRAILADLDIELSGDVDSRSSDELMFVQRAFSVPSDKLFLFTHTAEINGAERFSSLAFNRVKALFGDKIAHTYRSDDFDYLIPAPKNAVGFWRAIEDESKRASLACALEDYVPNISSSLSSSAKAQECKVSSSSVGDALGTSIHFSASSFEKYARCPFSYYCSYVLKLREKVNAEFNLNDIGTFVHFVLETLLKNAIPNDLSAPMPDEETLIEMTDKAIAEYVSRILPPHLVDSKRMAHLYRRLRTLSLLLVGNIVEEFSKSSFRPAFFELKANGMGGAPSPLVFKLEDNSTISFSGIIDRVDIYKKGSDVYVRVVDYKTGTKNFNLADIDKGINTQMLLYLFTLCRTNSADFKRSLGVADGGNTLPAGVVYLSANIPVVEADDYSDAAKIISKASSKLERSGLLLSDEDVLVAMNSELDAKFLAGIKKNAKSGLYEGSAAASGEKFAETYDKLEAVIKKIASELRAGNADATPLNHKRSLPCDYCQARPICRRTDRGDGEDL